MREKSTGTAYLFWCLCLIGLCGGQRFYLGRPISGMVYLFTLGWFGFGQILDLFSIPGKVRMSNLEHRLLYPTPAPALVAPQVPVSSYVPEQVDPVSVLIRYAQRQPTPTLSQAQLRSCPGLAQWQISDGLHDCMANGYCAVGNDPVTGAIRYTFDVPTGEPTDQQGVV